MKYVKYRIIKEFGKAYIEIPYLWFFWQRLGYWKSHEVGLQTHQAWHTYSFNNHHGAYVFAEKHKYKEY